MESPTGGMPFSLSACVCAPVSTKWCPDGCPGHPIVPRRRPVPRAEGAPLQEHPAGSVPGPESVQLTVVVSTFRAETTVCGEAAPVPDPIAVAILPGDGLRRGGQVRPASSGLASCGVEGVRALTRSHARPVIWIKLPHAVVERGHVDAAQGGRGLNDLDAMLIEVAAPAFDIVRCEGGFKDAAADRCIREEPSRRCLSGPRSSSPPQLASGSVTVWRRCCPRRTCRSSGWSRARWSTRRGPGAGRRPRH